LNQSGLFTLGPFDTSIIVVYFAITLVVGLKMSAKARTSLTQYFLGGRKQPWYLLGIAGMAGWFDLTGTMIITSFLYMLGPRGLFIEFRGGAVLVLAFMIAYTGKWHRRSGCMTAAEWMTFRFGEDQAAQWMRVLTALMGIALTIGMLGYLVRGATLFAGMFVPYPPIMATGVLVLICTTYTVFSGFYGVILTDFVQGAIVLVACCIVSWMAYFEVSNLSELSQLALQTTGNSHWTESLPAWRTNMPRGYEVYEPLIMFALFYLLRNVLFGMGTGADSRYFASRSDRDCGLQSMLQGITVAFRWPMMISFAVLGLRLAHQFFPDQAVVESAAGIIHASKPGITSSGWHDVTSRIANHPEQDDPTLVTRLHGALGDDWREKLPLVGFYGNINPEQILPAVILVRMPVGVRGLLIVAMLGAMMSSLTGSVNQATALFVNDLYKGRLRPAAGHRELMYASFLATIGLVVAGFWMGVSAGSINELWGWIIMGLGGGALGPHVLRLYWWRCTAWGAVGGTLLGGTGALLQRALYPGMVEWKQFLLMASLSFGGTIFLSLATAPTDKGKLRRFYRNTRPFGFWAPFWQEISPAEKASWSAEHRNDILAIPFLLIAQVTLFLLPMQLVIHAYRSFGFTLPIFLSALLGVYFFWWKKLPPASDPAAPDAGLDRPSLSSNIRSAGKSDS
jgi:Na+/proline symporter